ncbi:MAG: pilin [Minisyncoccia bacterium]|jgi:hypothetical protein
MKKKLIVFASVLPFILPTVVQAQTPVALNCDPKTLCYVVSQVIAYLNLALSLLMAVAIVMFVWYVIKYYIRPNEERKQAGLYVMYSIIGFFVILSIWGIINILGSTFGLGNAGNQQKSWSSFVNLFPQQ